MARLMLILTILLWSSISAAEGATDAAAAAEPGEMTVEALRLQAEALYKARATGAKLYADKQYEEALPHLTLAAQNGFKTAQAQLGFMHAAGLGGAKQDSRYAIGWLGVAADGVTDPDIKKFFKESWNKIPKEHRPAYQGVVDTFISKYGAEVHNVKCARTNKPGSKIRALQCMIYDPDGRLVTDTLAEVERGNLGNSTFQPAGAGPDSSSSPVPQGGPGPGGGGGR
jgi:hypothetical protein